MKKAILYTLIALLTFVGFIAVFAPAAIIWRQVEAPIMNQVPDLSVVNVRGTLWQGNTEIYYRQFPGSVLNWTLAPLPLVTNQQAQSELKLEGDGHLLEGLLTADAKSLIVNGLNGFVDATYINRVSQPQGLTFVGRVDIRDLNITSDLAWIQQASGKIYWPGGRIVSRTLAAGTRVFDLPALTGDLSTEGRIIKLVIHPNDPSQTMVDIALKPDGWVVVAVKARLFDLAGLAWPSGSSLDDTVLQFEEQLLRGAR